MFSTQCLLIVLHFGSTRVAESKISERQEFLERRLKVNPPLGRIQAAAMISDDLQPFGTVAGHQRRLAAGCPKMPLRVTLECFV